VTAYLVVPNAVEALAFYARAFGAQPRSRMKGPAGEQSTLHAEMSIGNSLVMLTDENLRWGVKSPHALGGTPVSLHLYVDDADRVYQQALDAGCTIRMAIQDAFWGDRYGKVTDPYGHEWAIASRREQLTRDELTQRQSEVMSAMVLHGAC
jgi:uncharacterized glyoxalase superfamily protein PhnB